VRIGAAFLLIVCLAGCNRGKQSNEAVRQGVVDHLTKVGLNVKAMDVHVTAVEFKGNQADATVAIAPKGNAASGMSMRYHLEQQGGNWVVTGRGQDAGAPHSGGAMPPGGAGMMNPHGAMPPSGHGMAMPGAGAEGGMPAPQDLPPVGKKK